MSELGNLLRDYRGNAAQSWLASQAGINIRTIQRAENGEDVRLDTLRALCTFWKLGDSQWAEIIIAWMRLQLGPDFDKLDIRIKSKRTKAPQQTKFEQFIEVFRSIPAKHQHQLALAAKREEIIRSIAPLNDLYDRISNRQKLS